VSWAIEGWETSPQDSTTLVDLLTDDEARDAILDHPLLFERILEHGAPLHISPQFYFYVLIRHVLKETGLADCATSDYVASLLERFSTQVQMRSPADGRTGPVQYMGDMMIALQKASQTVRRCGSAALDCCLVADGTYEGYWERKVKPWDVCAGAAIVRAAGGTVTDFDGGSSFLATGLIVATNGSIHRALLEALVASAASAS
jgi:hypothetical protein